ncbi:MAG: GAF domain-containing protein [Deltaproteobacteria bacterium]|nr:GAF domain-containing protein [Deltaproteobacteria bacterium]
MPRLATAAAVAEAVSTDPRLSAWTVVRKGEPAIELTNGSAVAVLVWPSLWQEVAHLTPHIARARSGGCSLILCGSDDDFESVHLEDRANLADVEVATVPMSVARLMALLSSCNRAARLRHERDELEVDLGRARYENELLVSIGRALSQQRDIDSLLTIILSRAREVTGADAGSVYVVEGSAEDVSERSIRFKIAQNDSVAVDSQRGFTMPVSSSSIVGACVLSGEVIQIPDLYQLDEPGQGNNPWGFVHDRSFDLKTGYQTRSMVALPMIDARGQCIGVIQLINKLAPGVDRILSPEAFDASVQPFDAVSINLAAALASQAGVALETALLYDEVKTLFEGFVKASVTAIESRDPTTSGHSERVAELTTTLAKVADRTSSGPYAELTFSFDELKQIEYAALLHDFGKVGVRENVLVKAKKLYTHQRAQLEERFKYIRRSIELDAANTKIEYLLDASREQVADQLRELDSDVEDKLRELDRSLVVVFKANEPTVLETGGLERIADVAAQHYMDLDGTKRPYLSPDEVTSLQILRGSLTSDERREIESHVVHTFNFLREIPWGRTFRSIPEIAGAHHEKLDGSGYPHGLAGSAIPTPAKMMTISDIFDALTAADRPYKRSVPVDRALDILEDDVKRGRLDENLFRMFVEAKVFRVDAD